MIFGFAILLVAIAISAVAAYYSIMGLVAIFAAAVLPIIIMGSALELGKIAATVWLHQNWQRAAWLFKMYLVPAVFFLMFLTSMGIFGFLSKAHVDQGINSGDVSAQIELIETKIATQRENINAARKVLTQMDGAVDEVLARSKTEQGARNANTLRNQQAKDRAKLASDIEKAQATIATLNEEKSVISKDLRKVEAEVGPIKYIAQLIYGDNPDANLLEKAVRWVIILIVIVFDPLALVLILCANKQFYWAKEARIARRKEREAIKKSWVAPVEPVVQTFVQPVTEPAVPEVKEEVKEVETTSSHYAVEDPVVVTTLAEKKTPRKRKPVITEIVAPIETVVEEIVSSEPTTEELELIAQQELARMREAAPAPGRGSMYTQPVVADNVPTVATPSNASFGNEYPTNPRKGDVFLRVDFLPNRLFKYNGNKWIEVDKNQTDVYAYEEQYIKYLVDQIAAGKYDQDLLTEVEAEQIQLYLRKNAQ